MKKIFAAIATAFLLIATPARADEIAEAQAYTQGIINRAIVEIFTEGTTLEQRIPPFRDAIKANLNFDSIATFILGVHARGLAPADLEDFIDAFTELNVQSYARQFGGFVGIPVEVTRTTAGRRAGEFFVYSSARNPDGRSHEIIWRVGRQNGGFRVMDIVFEGVSMAMSFRNEYAQTLAAAASAGQPPVPTLTARIRERLASF